MLLRVKRLEVNRTGDESRCHRRYRLTQRSWSSVQRISAWAFDNPWLSKSIRNFLVWPWNDDTTAKSQSRLWRTSSLLHDLHLRWFTIILLTKASREQTLSAKWRRLHFLKESIFSDSKEINIRFLRNKPARLTCISWIVVRYGNYYASDRKTVNS